MKKIAIIGAGKMGTALFDALKSGFNVELWGRNQHSAADTVIFCIKPQDFASCVEGLSQNISEKLVISIMAGVSLKTLMEKTGARQVVRSMPNLPALMGKGFTAWIATPEVRTKELVKSIFLAVGEEMEVREESQLDAITALSGSGPGYFFYFCELLEEKAKEWGFTQEEAKKIVESTLAGSAKLLEEGGKTTSEWKEAVCSRGGTTYAAIEYLEKNGFAQLVKGALEAAKKRSQELQ